MLRETDWLRETKNERKQERESEKEREKKEREIYSTLIYT